MPHGEPAAELVLVRRIVKLLMANTQDQRRKAPVRIVVTFALLAILIATALQGVAYLPSTSGWRNGLRSGLITVLFNVSVVACNLSYQRGYQDGQRGA